MERNLCGIVLVNVDDFIPTRRSLLTRLKNWDDQEGWRVFFDTYWKLIYGVAIQAGLTDTEAQDVVQETVITVAKKFKEQKYQYDPKPGSFKGWLLHTTRWRIQDQFRKRKRHGAEVSKDEETSETPTLERVPDPASFNLDAIWDEEWHKNLTDAAIQRVKRQVEPKAYQMFDLHVLRQWPAETVARKLHTNRPKVYYAKYKVSALIKKEIRRLERKGI